MTPAESSEKNSYGTFTAPNRYHPYTLMSEMDKPARTNILLVDDRRERLLALQTILDPLGQHLVSANSGTEALRELLRHEFAVILLDVHMPGMDGFETAQLIRDRRKSAHTPIIFVTGSQEWEDMERAYSLGAVDFISVPIAPVVLRAKVSVFVELFQAVEQARLESEGRVREELARKQAEAESHAKDEFLATVSHELRTPLTPILATIQTLEHESDHASLRQGLHVMRRNLELEARLIDDLLDLTRIRTGKLHLHEEVINLQNSVMRAVEICRPKAKQRDVQLDFQSKAREKYVQGDAARLQQVFWNLIHNAIKFTKPGGKVSVRMVNQDPDEVRVDVIDTGIGIEPRSLTEVFNRFMQINRPSAPEGAQGGLGLGLAISKSIIDAHQGEITASSLGLERGATLSVVLKTTQERPDGVPSGTDGTSVLSEEPLRILLVEDHEDTRNALRRLLIRKGYEVETAEDVGSALKLAAEKKFDLLVSDIGLPDGTGVDLMLELKKSNPLPGIALSGFGMQQDIDRSREAGFIEHLTKPVSFTELQAVIAKHRASVREARERELEAEAGAGLGEAGQLPSAVNGTAKG